MKIQDIIKYKLYRDGSTVDFNIISLGNCYEDNKYFDIIKSMIIVRNGRAIITPSPITSRSIIKYSEWKVRIVEEKEWENKV